MDQHWHCAMLRNTHQGGANVLFCVDDWMFLRVTGLVLRAICLMRQEELDWMFSSTGIATQIPKVRKRQVWVVNKQLHLGVASFHEHS